jgi:hypothetical protein
MRSGAIGDHTRCAGPAVMTGMAKCLEPIWAGFEKGRGQRNYKAFFPWREGFSSNCPPNRGRSALISSIAKGKMNTEGLLVIFVLYGAGLIFTENRNSSATVPGWAGGPEFFMNYLR